MDRGPLRKPLFWVGSSREDLRGFPEEVKDMVGHAGDTFRAVYTVKFVGAVYVLHAFQKRSKHGIKTPKKELDLIRERLRRAEEEYAGWSKQRE